MSQLKDRYKNIEDILSANGEDLNDFLRHLRQYNKQHKYYIKEKLKNKTRANKTAQARKLSLKRARKYLLRFHTYAFLVNPEIAAKFRIIAISENISPRILLEAFMNSYIEGNPDIIELMKNINNYHIKTVLRKTSVSIFSKRIERIKKIINYYTIPVEWWKKYADLKVDDLDF